MESIRSQGQTREMKTCAESRFLWITNAGNKVFVESYFPGNESIFDSSSSVAFCVDRERRPVASFSTQVLQFLCQFFLVVSISLLMQNFFVCRMSRVLFQLMEMLFFPNFWCEVLGLGRSDEEFGLVTVKRLVL